MRLFPKDIGARAFLQVKGWVGLARTRQGKINIIDTEHF